MSSRKTVLETINDNSLVLYYLLNKKKIKIDTLYQAVLSKNKNIVFVNFVHKIYRCYSYDFFLFRQHLHIE